MNRDIVKKHYLKFAGGGLQINLGKDNLLSVKIPLPPIAEQKRIAAILDKADAVRRKRREAIRLTEELLRSVFLDMFEREKNTKVKLIELAAEERNSFVNGPFGSDLLTSELQPSGVPVVYIRDIRNGRYERVSESFVSDEKYQQLKACQVFPMDVLVAKVGDPPGISAIYPHNFENAIVTQDVIRIRVNLLKVVPEFLSSYLNSELGKFKLKPIIVEATRSRFSLRDFKALEIEIVPLKQQIEFKRLFQKIMNSRSILVNQLQESEDLFNSLLQRAFTGNL